MNRIITTFLSLVLAANIYGQIITTVAGNGILGYSGDGGVATSSELNTPYGTCFDALGNLYIADAQNHRIRKVDYATGIITTFAGTGIAGYSGDGGAAISAQFNRPTDIAIDASGNLYISDELNFVVRKINTSGIISTYAGTHVTGYTGDGAATSANLSRVNTISIDNLGNIYISLYQNSVIRKINTSGIITTVAGNGTSGFSGDGGAATSAELNEPCKVAIDNSGNLYIADEYNQRIRKVNTSGVITTVVGNGTAGFSGDGGAATLASINYCEYVNVDASGNLYIADKTNNRIRKVDASGIITTIAGTGTQGYSGDGGPATSATFKLPQAMSLDAYNNMYITDGGNNVVRKIANECSNITSTSIKGINSKIDNNFTIYPNPTNSIITIKSINSLGNIAVYNLIGQLLFQKEAKENNFQIDLSNYEAGVYFVVARGSQAKIIKQ